MLDLVCSTWFISLLPQSSSAKGSLQKQFVCKKFNTVSTCGVLAAKESLEVEDKTVSHHTSSEKRSLTKRTEEQVFLPSVSKHVHAFILSADKQNTKKIS